MALLQLAPHAVFHAHCCAFLEKTADAAKLLSDIFGAAGDTTQQAVQVVQCTAVFCADAHTCGLKLCRTQQGSVHVATPVIMSKWYALILLQYALSCCASRHASRAKLCMNVVMPFIVWPWTCTVPKLRYLSMVHCVPAVTGAGTATAAATTDIFSLRVSTNRPVPQSACSCGKHQRGSPHASSGLSGAS